jgi:hypothetical protein
MSRKPTPSLASITDNYLLYSDKTDLAIKPEPFHDHDNDIKTQDPYPLNEAKVETVITVVDKPSNNTSSVMSDEPSHAEQERPAPEWDILTSFYFGSLTVVGLYVFFRLLQKSK